MTLPVLRARCVTRLPAGGSDHFKNPASPVQHDRHASLFFRQRTAAVGTPTAKFQTQFGSLLFGYFIFLVLKNRPSSDSTFGRSSEKNWVIRLLRLCYLELSPDLPTILRRFFYLFS
nr:hypothetical protein [Escherichia coli]